MLHICVTTGLGFGVAMGCTISTFFIGMGIITREWHIVPIILATLYALFCFLHILGDQL